MEATVTASRAISSCLIFAAAGFLSCSRRDAPPEELATVETNSSGTHSPIPPDKIDPVILEQRLFREAPTLEEKVARGEIPPISDRLPENPMIIRPLETLGEYGGTLRRAVTGDISGRMEFNRTFNENLMKFERSLARTIELNLAESYEFLDEGRTAIFRIRKGIRWSDGVPFTGDDILFWYYDVAFNEDARDAPFGPSEWMLDGEPLTMERVDHLTLRISSREPLGRVLFALCHENLALPRHFYAPFHPKYNPTADYEGFRKRTTSARRSMTPGTPTIAAWKPVEWVHGQRIVYERNPYYWKVDTDGSQLPYIDRIVFTVIPGTETILLKFINGELDLLAANARVSMAPTLRSEERKGIFHTRVAPPNTGPVFFLNWDAQRAALRAAFRDKAVRMALSHAINREEINQIAFHGLLTPLGFSFYPNNPYYSPESSQRYIEFDPQKARDLLDEAGYRDRDGDGFRELKDGSRFEITVDTDLESEFSDVCELVADYWSAIGIKTHLFVARTEIVYDLRLNGNFEIHVYRLDGASEPLGVPHQWGIWKANTPFWHRNAAREGPEWLKEVSRLFRDAMIALEPDQQRAAMERIRELHSENVSAISIGATSIVWGVNRRLGNVPYELTTDNAYRAWSHPLYFEQITIK